MRRAARRPAARSAALHRLAAEVRQLPPRASNPVTLHGACRAALDAVLAAGLEVASGCCPCAGRAAWRRRGSSGGGARRSWRRSAGRAPGAAVRPSEGTDEISASLGSSRLISANLGSSVSACYRLFCALKAFLASRTAGSGASVGGEAGHSHRQGEWAEWSSGVLRCWVAGGVHACSSISKATTHPHTPARKSQLTSPPPPHCG